MSATILKNVRIVTPDESFDDRAVVMEEGRIESLPPVQGPLPEGEVVDGCGGYLVPGFIDLHIHGIHRHLCDDGPEALQNVSRTLPQYGVTAFLPTLTPRKPGEDAAYVRSVAGAEMPGARAPGFFLEGPFLCKTGALPREALGGPDAERVKSLIDACGDRMAVFAVSPEFEGITDLLPLMTASAPAFITHTQAGVKDTQAAVEAGARHGTHFYDVFYAPEMTDGGVRPCGAVEVLLADPRCTVDFILDGVHVDPVAVQMALRCKGPDGVCLITDANVGAGLPPARYTFGGQEIDFEYDGAPARLVKEKGERGGLAGSGLTLDRAVANACSMLEVELAQAVRMASLNPARVLRLDDRRGRIREGYDADLVLLDTDLNVQQTWVGGQSVYRAS